MRTVDSPEDTGSALAPGCSSRGGLGGEALGSSGIESERSEPAAEGSTIFPRDVMKTSPRLFLVALPGLGLLLLASVQIRSLASMSDRRVGFMLVERPDGLQIEEIVPDGPAALAGIRSGDRLVAVNSQEIRTRREYDDVARRFTRATPQIFTLERSGVRLDETVRPGMEFPRWTLVLNLLTVAFYFLLAGVAALRFHQDLRARLLWAYSLAVAIEYSLPIQAALSTLLGVVSAALFLALTGLQMGLDVHLASLIPDRPGWLQRRPWIVPTYYTVGAAFAVYGLLPTLFVEILGRSFPWTLQQAEFFVLSVGLPLWALAVTVLLSHRFATHREREGRMQAGTVLLGQLPWAFVVVALGVVDLQGLHRPFVPDSVWALVGVSYPLAVFVAIFRHHLFDLERVVRRAMLFGALTTVLVLGFYAAIGAGGMIFAEVVEEEGKGPSIWVVSAATLILGLLFNPLRNRIEGWIDSKFFPERRELRRRVIELASELPAQGKLARMGEHLTSEIGRIFYAQTATVWLSASKGGQLLSLASTRPPSGELEMTHLIAPEDPGLRYLAQTGRPCEVRQLVERGTTLASRLREEGAAWLVPLLTGGRLLGVILLGPRLDGRPYSSEELELLELLAQHAATVFENARLFDSATYEGLTGLYRREAVLEILDREWSRAQRYDRPLSIALVDLDRFKEVNDRHGHLAGDAVLQRVAHELKSVLRDSDFIGRYGGEEFLIVLPETPLQGARLFAEKLREYLAGVEIPLDSGSVVRLTLSAGVAGRESVPGALRARALLAAADEALYAAKHRGRNRVEAAIAPTA